MDFTIRKIEKTDLPRLEELSDFSLGINYLTTDYFEKVLLNQRYSAYTVFINKVLVSFLVFYKTSKNKVISYLNDASLIYELDNSIICLDTMVVDPKFRRKGIGNTLIEKVIKENKNQSGFLMYTWKQNNMINMKSIADFFSFAPIKEYTKLWENDCIENKFKCPVKPNDENTCICSCMLYYLKRTN